MLLVILMNDIQSVFLLVCDVKSSLHMNSENKLQMHSQPNIRSMSPCSLTRAVINQMSVRVCLCMCVCLTAECASVGGGG